jgi:hypothetical protein
MYRTIIILSFVFLGYMDCQALPHVTEGEKDNCATATALKNTILDFIYNGDKSIYEKEFLSSFQQNNEKKGECFFPDNEMDVKLYLALGDSALLKELNTDERAMPLLIDLYLLNGDNTEVSNYYDVKVIPKAALKNTEAFVRALSGKTESEVIRCIASLQNIKQKEEKEKLKEAMKNLGKEEYLSVIDKMNEALK